jgi:hypothetical protein
VVALENAMLIADWNMLHIGKTFNEPDGDFYSKRRPEKAKRRAIDQLRNMGFTVTIEPRRLIRRLLNKLARGAGFVTCCR